MAQEADPFADPFVKGGSDDKPAKPGESVYDFDDVHKWDDVRVKLKDKDGQKLVKWSTNVASHRGVAGKSQTFSFRIDFKAYEDSLHHPDSNRGVILMAGDLRFPLLYCWLRPFEVHGGEVDFTVSVPQDRLKEMYVAFIPREGKSRYLYNLNEVALQLSETPMAQENEVATSLAVFADKFAKVASHFERAKIQTTWGGFFLRADTQHHFETSESEPSSEGFWLGVRSLPAEYLKTVTASQPPVDYTEKVIGLEFPKREGADSGLLISLRYGAKCDPEMVSELLAGIEAIKNMARQTGAGDGDKPAK